MNQQELEKHIKFDLIISVLLYSLIGVLFLITIFVILASPVKASEIKTTNITGGVANTNNCGTKTNGNYCYGYTNTGEGGTTWYRSSFGATNGFDVSNLSFDMNSTFPQYFNVPATLQIKSTANSFKNTTYNCSWSGSNAPSSCSVVRVSSNQLNINFRTPLSGTPQYLYIDIGTRDNFDTYLSNININQIILLQTVDDPNASIIENNNQNTSQIINNQNENTQEQIENNNQNTSQIINNQDANTIQTIDSININGFKILEQLSDACTNLIDLTKLTADTNVTISGTNSSTGAVTINNTATNEGGLWTDYIPINTNLTYYFSGNLTAYSPVNGWRIYMVQYDSNKNQLASYRIWNNQNACQNQSACFNNRTRYVRIHLTTNENGGSRTWNKVKFMPTPINSNYCAYGTIGSNKLDLINGSLGTVNSAINTTNNKLDQQITIEQQQKNLQEQQNNYLMDDTNPTVDSSGIQNAINSVQTTNPLSYLLTLPTNLLTAILNGLSSNSCTDFEIGKFGTVGRHDLGTYTFKFPCVDIEQKIGSSLYNTIDIFVAIGILVLTIVKLYNVIASYTSLGATDEIPSHFLRPMDFLGNILGGNISGVGSSINNGGTL